ncbi:MAG: Flp family type IVb pilin [Emcibacteraceae bacterium]|nr:Flp family type IVb pilin [Emcibacteraceae bacterium]
MEILKTLKSNKLGATAIEYGLLAAIIALGITTILSSYGSTINDTFVTVGTTIDAVRD